MIAVDAASFWPPDGGQVGGDPAAGLDVLDVRYAQYLITLGRVGGPAAASLWRPAGAPRSGARTACGLRRFAPRGRPRSSLEEDPSRGHDGGALARSVAQARGLGRSHNVDA